MVPLVVEGLLVHLVHVAVRVAVHLYAVGRGGDAVVRAIDLLRRLREDRRGGLGELGHAVVEEAGIRLAHGVAIHAGLGVLRAGCAIALGLGDLRGELVFEVVDVGETVVCGPAMAEADVVEVGQVEVVEVVKVD
jgi:hypothetical protein